MTTGKITANLPSRDFGRTETFYHALGFQTIYRGDGWMIVDLNGMRVEFFPHPDLKPKDSWFSASLRLPGIDTQHSQWSALDHWTQNAPPRLIQPMQAKDDAPRMFAMIDPDGSLWRVMEGQTSA
jgi:hypothetical protein